MEVFFQLLIYGLQLGSVYALLAIGYSMVYGIVGMINFAHGDFLMIGAFVVYFMMLLCRTPTFLIASIGVMFVSMAVTGFVGSATEKIAYKPLRNRPKLSSLITSVGVSLFLENFLRALPFVGPDPRSFPQLFPVVPFQFGDVTVTSLQMILIGTSVILMLVVHLFSQRSKWGKQMQAVSMDRDAAFLMGIDVDKIISITFFIGAGLAAVSGVFYSSIYPMINVYMGSWLGTKAFIAAVFGGIGDIRGAMLGGMLMGIIEMAATYINADLGYGIAFVILVFVLLFKPEGLIGKPTIEKV